MVGGVGGDVMIARLGEVCSKATSNIAQKDLEGREGEYPIYGASGFITNVSFYQQEKPYIAVVKDGAGIGRIMKLPAKSSVIGTMQYIIPNQNIDISYLAYAMEHMNLAKYYTGATIPHIYFKDYQKEIIHLLPLDKQCLIAAVLNKVSDLIALRKQQLAKLDELVKSQFVEKFGDPIKNPMGWKMRKLGDLSVQINSGNTPKGGEQVYVEKGIVFFRSQNVWKNRLEMEDIAYIDKATHQSMRRSSLKRGDILMTKTGRVNTENSSLGRAALYMGEDDAANVNGHVYFIRLKPEVNNKFILRILISDEYKNYIRSVCVGGIDKRQLNKNHIEDFPIICPSEDMIEQYVLFIEKVDKSKLTIQQSLDKLEIMKKALMQKYFG